MIDFEISEKEERIDVCIISSISDDEFQIDLNNFWEFIKKYTLEAFKYNDLSEYLRITNRESIKNDIIQYLRLIKKIDF